MKFHGSINVFRHAEDEPEKIEIYADYFQAESIQSAKAKLTRMANGQVLFSYVQSWDNETREYTGKDLRWKPWLVPPLSYEQDDGTPVGYSYRRSEREGGEFLSNSGSRYSRSVGYVVELRMHWNRNHVEKKEKDGQRKFES